MYSIVTILASIGVAALFVKLLLTGRRCANLPPGPRTIPVLGNLHLMPKKDLHLAFQKWAQQYGPVYSLILGTKTIVVLSSPEAVRDLLDKKGHIYSDRQDHYLGQTVLSQGNRMVMMHYGPTWRMIRRMIHGTLNVERSAAYIPYQDLENKQMLVELLDDPERFLDSIRRYSMSLTTSIIYGFRVTSFDDPRLIQLFDTVDALTEIVQSASAALLEVFPLLRWLPDAFLPMQKRAKRCHIEEERLFTALWMNVKANLDKAKPCFCVNMSKVQEKEKFSDSLAAYTAGTVLEAGADTTSNTLYGFVQAMLLFPEVQKKAQQHLDAVVGDRLPNMDDYVHLPYIRSCVKEATRWMPTAILGFPHAVMEDDEYMGYRIPKGAGVFNNVYTIHMDATRNVEPHRFMPERFDGDESNLVDSVTNADPAKRASFAFGAGRRVCQGMHVAERSLFLAVARLLWAFDISPCKNLNGHDILPDPTKLTQGFVCMPEPFQASIRPKSKRRAEMVKQAWAEAQTQLDVDTKQWK